MAARAGSRRGAMAGSGMVLALLAAVLAWLAPPAAGQEHDGILPEGDWTEEEMALAADLVARTEAALPAFSDVETIQALGFENFGVTAPGGYDHWINWDWVDDGHLIDPEFPESLVFRQVGDDYVLQAAMFLADSHHTMDNLPADIAWWPGWHTHENVCVDENRKFAGLAGPGGDCPPGSQTFDRPPMMHVWIVDNECGHRFGEIDVGGLICDVHHGHGPGPGHEPEPGGHDPGHDMPPAAPPAQPIRSDPNFTG